MAFKVQYTDDGHICPIEYLPCGAIAPKVGMALVQTGGNLAIATGTQKPTYISMCEKEAACTAGDLIPVIRVQENMVFETTFSAAATSVKLGDKVTLHATSGMEVTATTTGGACEVVAMDGAAVGDTVWVRFVLNPPASSGS